MIPRPALEAELQAALRRSPVVALLGPRQCGKTTLALDHASSRHATVFDLEDPTALAALDVPHTALASVTGLVVIDEVQRKPELFPVLRVLADRRGATATFLILGSASPSSSGNLNRSLDVSLSLR